MNDRSPVPELIALLRDCGAVGVEHDSRVPFVDHLAGGRRVLGEWGLSAELQDAGLLHSIYGTEFFDAELTSGPSRDQVRALVGERAERIVWLWCNTRRASIRDNVGRDNVDGDHVNRDGELALLHRDGSRVAVTACELRDLVDLWCADAVEQQTRLTFAESDLSRDLPHVIALASPPAAAAVRAATAMLASTAVLSSAAVQDSTEGTRPA